VPNDTILIDPEVARRRRKTRRRLKIAGALVLVLILGYFLGRPARHAIKAWQARRHAEAAFDFIAAEKWTDASREARAAYQLRATEPAAIRAVARLLSRTRQTEALGFWKALGKKEPLTREDLRDEASISLTAGDNLTAETAVKELLGKTDGGPGPADWLLAAQLAAQHRTGEQVSGYSEKVVADPKSTERQLFQASLFQLAAIGLDAPGGKQTQASAWMRVTKIARGQSAVALDALTILAQHALSSPNEIVSDPAIMPEEEVIRRLETHPLSRVPQKLLATDLRMHVDPAQREALIVQAAQTWRPADNESLAALARWLNSKGEFQRELDTIALDRALQTRELFLQHLDALGALGQWAEIKRLLQDETFPLDPVIEHMYLARCNQQLGEITAGENNWQRALESAAGDPQKLLSLAEYAEKNGAASVAETAYNTIVRDTPGIRAAQQGRLRLAQQSRDTRKIHGILEQMLKQWPNDSAIQNDEAYTRLLLLPGGMTALPSQSGDAMQATVLSTAAAKSEIRTAKSEAPGSAVPASNRSTPNAQLSTVTTLAADLVRREPASLPHRTLLALARLKQDEPAKALEVYSGINIPRNALSPASLAVHAAVLAANGQEEDAKTEVAEIKSDQLLPEEQALVKKLR
jgi:hypothetical protein